MIPLTFRLAGELPSLARLESGCELHQELTAPASLKDCLEAAGIPHTEVDRILSDGEPADLGRLVAAESTFDVHPVGDAIGDPDPDRSAGSLQPRPLRRDRFVCDVHLGKLARMLRMLGFDTHYDPELDEPEIAGLAEREERAVLSCSRPLLFRNQVAVGRLLRSRQVDEQVREVVRRFGLSDRIRLFSRCSICNGGLERVEKSEILARIPPRTRAWRDEFHRCSGCDRLYWEGTHVAALRRRIDAILEDE